MQAMDPGVSKKIPGRLKFVGLRRTVKTRLPASYAVRMGP